MIPSDTSPHASGAPPTAYSLSSVVAVLLAALLTACPGSVSPIDTDADADADTLDATADADTADTQIPDVPHVLIPCNEFVCDVTEGSVCCVDSQPEQIGCHPAPGQGVACAYCDGPEDCPAGTICCEHGNDRCTPPDQCETAYRFANRICHTDADCTAARPFCCDPPEPPLDHRDDVHICTAIDCAIACAGLNCDSSQPCCAELRSCVTPPGGIDTCRLADAGM